MTRLATALVSNAVVATMETGSFESEYQTLFGIAIRHWRKNSASFCRSVLRHRSLPFFIRPCNNY
jgi:hypothetical protein